MFFVLTRYYLPSDSNRVIRVMLNQLIGIELLEYSDKE